MKLVSLALKDLKLLLRDRLGAFFVIGFPILMGLFFGLVMQGPQLGSTSKMKLAWVDQDQSELSRQFQTELSKNNSVQLEVDSLDAARDSVRLGKRAGMIVIPEGFSQTAGILWEPQPEIHVGVDPSRSAEAAMLEGFLMQATASLIGQRFQQPRQFLPAIEKAKEDLAADATVSPLTKGLLSTFLGSVESMVDSAAQVQGSGEGSGEGFEMNFANIKRVDVTRQLDPKTVGGQISKLRSRWDISFPQAMMWGILGCVAGFAISLARERSQGTLVRLQAAPLSKTHILLGKALACFLTCLLVIVIMSILGISLGMQPASYPKLIVAALVTSFCFVGIMMTMSVLGKTEESVNGSGWAINMVMAMLGGGMIPVMFMPSFLQQLSVISPIHWAIRMIEGAIWREFSWWQLAQPGGVLLGIGLVGLTIGSIILHRRQN